MVRRVSSTSGRSTSWAMADRTSARKSAWFSHTRRITEALVNWIPVSRSTWSKTLLNVRLPVVASIPSSLRISRPPCSITARNSSRLNRGLRLSVMGRSER